MTRALSTPKTSLSKNDLINKSQTGQAFQKMFVDLLADVSGEEDKLTGAYDAVIQWAFSRAMDESVEDFLNNDDLQSEMVAFMEGYNAACVKGKK